LAKKIPLLFKEEKFLQANNVLFSCFFGQACVLAFLKDWINRFLWTLDFWTGFSKLLDCKNAVQKEINKKTSKFVLAGSH
jgi:hypothetical protein